MDPELRRAAEAAKGFMPPDEGLALYEAARQAAASGSPLLEVGTYCGKSSIYLGAAAREGGVVVYTIDHHRGSEEMGPGWEHHDPDVVDERTGRMDSLPIFRRTIADAGLEDVVIAIVGGSATIARNWTTPLGFLFIDGGHSEHIVMADVQGWAPKLAAGGTLVFHDVFADPADGGQGPYRAYLHALEQGFTEVGTTGSLRVLRR